MKQWLAISLAFLTGCVQFPDSSKVNTRTETSAKASPAPIQAEQVTDLNARKISEALWDEIEADR